MLEKFIQSDWELIGVDLFEIFFTDLDEYVTASRSRSETSDAPERETPDFFRDPSHVCQSCGEEYDTDPGVDIDSCRRCGGVKVERA